MRRTRRRRNSEIPYTAEQLYQPALLDKYDAVGFTSNGVVANGKLVSGRGSALDVNRCFPSVSAAIGSEIQPTSRAWNKKYEYNRVVAVQIDPSEARGTCAGITKPLVIFNFPTQKNFNDSATLKLIEKSAKELAELADKEGWKNVALPFPGLSTSESKKSKLTEEQIRKVLAPLEKSRASFHLYLPSGAERTPEEHARSRGEKAARKKGEVVATTDYAKERLEALNLPTKPKQGIYSIVILGDKDRSPEGFKSAERLVELLAPLAAEQEGKVMFWTGKNPVEDHLAAKARALDLEVHQVEPDQRQLLPEQAEVGLMYILPSNKSDVTGVLLGKNLQPTTEVQWDALTALRRSSSLKAVLDKEVFESYRWDAGQKQWALAHSDEEAEDPISSPKKDVQRDSRKAPQEVSKKSAAKKKEKAFYDLIVFGAPPSVGKKGLKVPSVPDVYPAFSWEYPTLSATIGNTINEQPATKNWERFPMVTVTVPNREGVPHTFMNLPVRKSVGTQPTFSSVMFALSRLEKRIKEINREKKVLKLIGLMYDSSSFLGLGKLSKDAKEKTGIKRKIADIESKTGVTIVLMKKDTRKKVSLLTAIGEGEIEGVVEGFKRPQVSEEREVTIRVQLENTFNPLVRTGGCENEPRVVVLNAWGYADVKVYLEHYLLQLEDALQDWTRRCVEAWCNNKVQAWKKSERGAALRPGIEEYFPGFITFSGTQYTEDDSRPYQTYGSMLIINDERSGRGILEIDSCLTIVIVSQRDTYFELAKGTYKEYLNAVEALEFSPYAGNSNKYITHAWDRMSDGLERVLQLDSPAAIRTTSYYFGDRNQTAYGESNTQTLLYQHLPPESVFGFVAQKVGDQAKMINLEINERGAKFAGYPKVRESQLMTQGVQGVTGKLKNLFLLGTQAQLKQENGDYLSPVMGQLKSNPSEQQDDDMKWVLEREDIIERFSPNSPIYYYTPVFAANMVYEIPKKAKKKIKQETGAFTFVYGEVTSGKFKLKSKILAKNKAGTNVLEGGNSLNLLMKAVMDVGNYTAPPIRSSIQFGGHNYLNEAQIKNKEVWVDNKLFTTLEVLEYDHQENKTRPWRNPPRLVAFAPIKPFFNYGDRVYFINSHGRMGDVLLESQLKFTLIKESFQSFIAQTKGAVRSVVSINWSELGIGEREMCQFTSYSGKTFYLSGVEAFLQILKDTLLKTYNIDVFVYNVPGLQEVDTVETARSIELIQKEQVGDVYAEEMATDSYTGVSGYVGVLGKHESAYPFVIGEFPSFYLKNTNPFPESELYAVLYPSGKARRLSLTKGVGGLDKADIFAGQSLAMANVRNLLRNYIINKSVVLRNLEINGGTSPFQENMGTWETYFSRWKDYQQNRDLVRAAGRPYTTHLQTLLDRHRDKYNALQQSISPDRSTFWTKFLQKPFGEWSKLQPEGVTEIEENFWDAPEYAVQAYDHKRVVLKNIEKSIELKINVRQQEIGVTPYKKRIVIKLTNLLASVRVELKKTTDAYNEAVEDEKRIERYRKAAVRGELSLLQAPSRPAGEVPSLLLYGINQDGSYFKVNTKSDTGESSIFVPHYFADDPFDKLNVAILSLLEKKADTVRLIELAKGYASNKTELAALESSAYTYQQREGVAAKILARVLKNRQMTADSATLLEYAQGSSNKKFQVEKIVKREFGSGSLGGQRETQIEYQKKLRKELKEEGLARYTERGFQMKVVDQESGAVRWYSLPFYKEYQERRGRHFLSQIKAILEEKASKEEYDCILAPSVRPGVWNIPVDHRSYEDIVKAQSEVGGTTYGTLPEFEPVTPLPDFSAKSLPEAPVTPVQTAVTVEKEVAFSVHDSACLLAMVKVGSLTGQEKPLVFRALFNQLSAMVSVNWPPVHSGKKLVMRTFSYDWKKFRGLWEELNKLFLPGIAYKGLEGNASWYNAANALTFIQVGKGKSEKEMKKNMFIEIPQIKGIEGFDNLLALTSMLEAFATWATRPRRVKLREKPYGVPKGVIDKVGKIKKGDIGKAVNYFFADQTSRFYASTIEGRLTYSSIQATIKGIDTDVGKVFGGQVSGARIYDIKQIFHHLLSKDPAKAIASDSSNLLNKEDISKIVKHANEVKNLNQLLRLHGEGGLDIYGYWVVYTPAQIRANIFEKGENTVIGLKHLMVLFHVINAANRIILPVYRQQICGVK